MIQLPVVEDDPLGQLLVDTPPALVVLCIPVTLTYISFYLLVKGWALTSRLLVLPTLVLFYVGANVAPVRCRAVQAGLNFGVAIAIMKLLDVHALSLFKSLPTYTSGRPPRPAIVAFLLLVELRYESFTPNPIRHWHLPSYPFRSLERRRTFYSEKAQFGIHLCIFVTLQCLPQYLPIKALGVLVSIWLLWTGIQIVARYRTSPPLFGPIYLADSLASFWTETWHNAFAAPCLSLAYTPTTYILTHLRFPRLLVRSCSVLAAFALMSLFHTHAMAPILTAEGQRRIGFFFLANGVCTVAETAVWGRKKDWRRAVSAWVIELGLASWTVAECDVADGLSHADWKGLCRASVR